MIYRQAQLKDSESISNLNQKYYQAFIDGNKEKGFLKNLFSLKEVQTLIEQKEVVVAEWENSVIGYYLTNGVFETDVIIKRKKIVQELIQKGQLQIATYAFLTQAVVDKPFMGKGIAKELLKNLKELVRDKFDFLIGYIDIENLNAKEAHLKSGWTIFTETGNGWLAMTSVR